MWTRRISGERRRRRTDVEVRRGIGFEDDDEGAHGWNGEEDAVGVIRG